MYPVPPFWMSHIIQHQIIKGCASSLKKLIARRRRTGISKPLLNPRVTVARKFPVPNNNFRKFFEFINSSETGWFDIQVTSGVNIRFLMRIDSATDHSITGKRIFKPSGMSDYATIQLNTVVNVFDPGGLGPFCVLPPDDKSGYVVIVCISGFRGGTKNGMTRLRDILRNRLRSAYGVNPDNIFHRSWNINHSNDPLFFPLVNDLVREINRRTLNPSYLAIIGHSFGGWAACRLSKVTNKTPNFIGLVDPVFGISNTLMKPRDVPRGSVITNWFQNNGVNIPSMCLDKTIPCTPLVNGISCGFQDVPGAVRKPVEFLRTASGTIRTVNCLGKGRVRLCASHVTIDDDAHIHRLIFNQINNDLSKIIKNNA